MRKKKNERAGSNERGEGRVGFLIALVLIGIAAFAGMKIIPVRITAYEFRDLLREECRYAAVRDSDTVVQERILRRAKELNIPLDPKNLNLQRNMREMVISARYEQPIDLKVTTYVYRFDATEKAPLF